MSASAHAIPLTVVSAGNEKFWRCLYQLLRSAERQRLAGKHRFLVYDLGLSAMTLQRLTRRFAWCTFRRFAFERYPPHLAIARQTYAWKPVIVAETLEQLGGHVLWLDSATIFRSSLDTVQAVLRRHGIYTLKSQTPVGESCDPATIAALGAPPEILHWPELGGSIAGFDAAHAGARKLVTLWREHALIEAHIMPRTPPLPLHRHDQSMLSVLLYAAAATGELAVNDEEIDISSRHPVRWMSSRNKVPPWLPTWADPFARLYYATYKTADRVALSYNHWKETRVHGLHRVPKERFLTFISRDGGQPVPVPAPRWSYYADPFVWRRDSRSWLFVEQFDYLTCLGRLCAVPLDDNLQAGPPQPILVPGYLFRHASFPFLFEHEGRLFMVPETCADHAIDLYVCDQFPARWRLVRRLIYGLDAADTLVFQRDGFWWLLTSVRDEQASGRHLQIHYSDDLLAGRWLPHPVNAERRHQGGSGRNAGTLVRDGDALLRPLQHNTRYYGESLHYMRIDRLTPTEFHETPYHGGHALAALAARHSPHHLSATENLVAWDVRDRVGFAERVPLLRRWALRPDPRALSLAAAHS
jgi:hypothetical protein